MFKEGLWRAEAVGPVQYVFFLKADCWPKFVGQLADHYLTGWSVYFSARLSEGAEEGFSFGQGSKNRQLQTGQEAQVIGAAQEAKCLDAQQKLDENEEKG